MLFMWALLLLAALGARVTTARTAASSSPDSTHSQHRLLDAAVRATLTTGIIAWVIPLALSLPSALASETVGASWLGAVVTVVAIRGGAIRRGWDVAVGELRDILTCPTSPLADPRTQILRRAAEGAWRFGLVVIFLATFSAAVLYPSTIWDSQAHHLPRLAQFEQNHTVAPFPTYYPSMNSTYPFASLVMTQIALFEGSLNTHLALLQWFAYAMSAALVYAISVRLGSGRMGARFATLLALSAPAVALQATSTQYDLVLAMWVLIAVYLALTLMERVDVRTASWLGLALGLGLVTKISTLLLFGPFALWLVYRATRSSGWQRALGGGLATVLIAVVVATPLFAMNLTLGGNVLGTGIPGNAHVAVPDRSPGALWTNGIRNLSVLISTPSGAVNSLVVRGASAAASLGGVPANSPTNKETSDAPYSLSTSAFNPDQAGAPITTVILFGCLIALALSAANRTKSSFQRGEVLLYALCSLSGLLAVATLITWQPFIVRTMTGSLLLVSPLAGVAISQLTSAQGRGATRAVARYALWATLALAFVYGLAAVTFSATSPLAPRSLVTGGSRVETGWWNTPYENRGWAGSLSYFVDDLDAAVLAIGPAPGARQDAVLIGGDAAVALPLLPLVSDLRDAGYFVLYEPRFGPAEVPGAHRDLLAGAADRPTAVISFDPPAVAGTTRVGGAAIGTRPDFELTLSRNVDELDVTVNVFVPVR